VDGLPVDWEQPAVQITQSWIKTNIFFISECKTKEALGDDHLHELQSRLDNWLSPDQFHHVKEISPVV
jgi:hypothetical protein